MNDKITICSISSKNNILKQINYQYHFLFYYFNKIKAESIDKNSYPPQYIDYKKNYIKKN